MREIKFADIGSWKIEFSSSNDLKKNNVIWTVRLVELANWMKTITCQRERLCKSKSWSKIANIAATSVVDENPFEREGSWWLIIQWIFKYNSYSITGLLIKMSYAAENAEARDFSRLLELCCKHTDLMFKLNEEILAYTGGVVFPFHQNWSRFVTCITSNLTFVFRCFYDFNMRCKKMNIIRECWWREWQV